VGTRKALREAVAFRVDDEIDVALVMQRHVFGTMPRDRGQPHTLEQLPQQFCIGRGIFDEFKSVGSHGVGEAELGVHGEMTALFRAEMAVPNT